MEFTGERFVPEQKGNIKLEHMHRYIQASEIAAGKTVLDIASGEGYGSAMLANGAIRVFGVDNSVEAVEHARKRYQKSNLEYLIGSCSDIPLPNASVDLVVSFETIEHHDQHDQMMHEIKRVLRKNGILLISSPDKLHYSDEIAFKNSYHVKELYKEQFKALIENWFANTAYFGQRITHGSCIFAESISTVLRSYSQEEETPQVTPGIKNPIYWIALASDAQLPEFSSGIFEQPINDSEIVQSWSKALHETTIKLHETEMKLKISNAALRSVTELNSLHGVRKIVRLLNLLYRRSRIFRYIFNPILQKMNRMAK